MIIKVILFYIVIFLTNIFIKKKNYLRSATGSSHQNFANISRFAGVENDPTFAKFANYIRKAPRGIRLGTSAPSARRELYIFRDY